ncbi:MAG: OmpA family protein [Clostridiaceae bacterium]|nr:OmpA family protein [Clostridiaceae bacterium]
MKGGRKPMPEDDPPEGAPEWMTTYSDLVTLLLTFFVLLFSMASVDKQKFEAVAYSLRSTFLNMSNGELYENNNGKDLISITDLTGQPEDEYDKNTNREDSDKKGNAGKGSVEERIDNFKDEVEDLIALMDLGDYIKIIDTEREIILRINSVILFDLGKADIKSSGKEALKKMGELLKELDSDAVVQGHTDNLPINTMLFPTNWELSTKRATNVVLFLIDECTLKPQKLTATGNGEFKPVAPNDTEVNRQKNRRIDVVIQKKDIK